MQLSDLGWEEFFEKTFEKYRMQGLVPMRIIRENRKDYLAYGAQGKFICEISGKFRFETDSKGKFPAVGDWVAVSARPEEKSATIHVILPRKSIFRRKVAGQVTEEQAVAANVDVVFIVCGLDLDFNLRRIERYLALAYESGARPVILLNKTDICPEAEKHKKEVESIAAGVDIYAMSAAQKTGMDILNKYIKPGKTAAFLGSSGVGKSTIINSLLATNFLKINEVSELGSRGRHTTTFRELMVLPEGGMVIDTPGMRELQVWGDEKGLNQVFDDIEKLSKECRFKDCTHQSEPGCAVREAVSSGALDSKRLISYSKLKKEYEYLSARKTMKPDAIEKARWKTVSQYARSLKKQNKN